MTVRAVGAVPPKGEPPLAVASEERPAVWPLRTAAGSLLLAAAAVSAMLLSDPRQTRLALNAPPAPSVEERAALQLLADADAAVAPVALDPPPVPRELVASEPRPLARVASADPSILNLDRPAGGAKPSTASVDPPPLAPAAPTPDRRVPDPIDWSDAFAEPEVASLPTPTPTPVATGNLLGGYVTREVVRRPAAGATLFGVLPLIGGPSEEVIETRETFLLIPAAEAAARLREAMPR